MCTICNFHTILLSLLSSQLEMDYIFTILYLVIMVTISHRAAHLCQGSKIWNVIHFNDLGADLLVINNEPEVKQSKAPLIKDPYISSEWFCVCLFVAMLAIQILVHTYGLQAGSVFNSTAELVAIWADTRWKWDRTFAWLRDEGEVAHRNKNSNNEKQASDFAISINVNWNHVANQQSSMHTIKKEVL